MLAIFSAASRAQDAPEAEPPVVEPPIRPRPIDGPPVDPTRADDRYRFVLRPMFWISFISRYEFEKGVGSDTIDLVDRYDVPLVSAMFPMFPLEGMFRTENQEFRFRYMFWRCEGGANLGSGDTVTFGGRTHTIRTDAELATHSLQFDFLQRIAGSDVTRAEFYLTAGADVFVTDFTLDGDGGSSTIDETIPILTVGMGLRFKLNEEAGLLLTSSALSYSQLLGLEDVYFDVEDTYRNWEVCVRWDKSHTLSWGAGWRHYAVGFRNDSGTLKAYQQLSGLVTWAAIRF